MRGADALAAVGAASNNRKPMFSTTGKYGPLWVFYLSSALNLLSGGEMAFYNPRPCSGRTGHWLSGSQQYSPYAAPAIEINPKSTFMQVAKSER